MLSAISAHALSLNWQFDDLYPICQIANLETSPKFPAMRYVSKVFRNANEGQILLPMDHEVFLPTFTAGDDYAPVNEILIFGPGSESVECLNVTINDDEIFEASESFILSLDVEHESVPVNAIVYILDDECKTHVYLNHSHSLYKNLINNT